MKEEIKVYNEKEEKTVIQGLKIDGYKKTHDCMWVKIYEKPNGDTITVTREY